MARFDPDLRIDEQNYDDGGRQNDQPIGNLNARYGCCPVDPVHCVLPVRLPRVMASSYSQGLRSLKNIAQEKAPPVGAGQGMGRSSER